MNIESTQNLSQIQTKQNSTVSKTNNTGGESDFAKELKQSKDASASANKDSEKKEQTNDNIDSAIDGLKDAVQEINENNKSENSSNELDSDKTKEELGLIDNNMNIQDPNQEKLKLQMGANMNFSSNNGQPFTEFINCNNDDNSLGATAKDLAEEKAILSTMEENIAIANRNMALQRAPLENKNSSAITDTALNYDSVIMSRNDADFFANLVQNGQLNMSEITNQSQSSHISKTLADLLAKSMNENKPIRIDFDNDISVIIKIDRAGKISADFLPSSQVAEAYLKENLPLLKQKFEDNNIDYNELNQRQRKQEQENRKKERKDE